MIIDSSSIRNSHNIDIFHFLLAKLCAKTKSGSLSSLVIWVLEKWELKLLPKLINSVAWSSVLMSLRKGFSVTRFLIPAYK